jgi:hypothetical protein
MTRRPYYMGATHNGIDVAECFFFLFVSAGRQALPGVVPAKAVFRNAEESARGSSPVAEKLCDTALHAI